MRNALRWCTRLLLLLFLPGPALAQTGQTAQIPLQFDFLNPGARSLGIGSAFVAVADDATAAFTNPAGLTQIVWPEVSVEARHRSLDTRFLSGGRLSGVTTGIGIDNVSGPVYGTSSDSALRPYFLSFVYPKGRWSIAAYRHELVLQNNSFVSQGAFQETVSLGVPNNNLRNPGLAGDRKIRIDNYGAGAGYRVSGRLSIGVGVAAYRFKIESDFGSLREVSGLFSSSDPATRGFDSSTTQTGDETRIAAIVGVHMKLNAAVQAGVTYRQGATFDFEQTTAVIFLPTARKIGTFSTPMVVGGGIRVQPTGRPWSIAVDYARVQYSRLTRDFITFQVEPGVSDRVRIRDGNEIHIGGEYRLARVPMTPSLRVGTWYDPAHAVQYASDGSNTTSDVRLKAVFPGGENVWHYSFGFGVPLSRQFEFNLGADLTKERRYVSASVVARFHR
jgi:long-chain fatty acid transport protein